MSKPERLKVLFITPWYPHLDNPMSGIFVREHARAVSAFHDVAVLHGLGRVDTLSTRFALEKDSFNVDPDLSPAEQIPTYVARYRKSIIPKTDRLLRLWSMRRAIKKTVNATFVPDLIHAHVHRMAMPAYVFAQKHNIPVVITEQHSAFSLGSLSRADVIEAKVAFAQAQKVMPVSQALQDAIESYGIDANFQIIPNVVDTDFFTPKSLTNPVDRNPVDRNPVDRNPVDRNPVDRNSVDRNEEKRPIRLLCVGGMPTTHVKGYPHLFTALASLETVHEWHLEIIGDGPVKEEYVRQVENLGLSNHITFHGFQPKQEIVKAMNRADIFVLASVWDSMPCVLIEAMSMGLPVVATKTGGIPEMVTSESGLLAEPGDPSSLRKALTEMFGKFEQFSPEQIQTLADEKYSYDAVGAMLDEVYRDAVAHNH